MLWVLVYGECECFVMKMLYVCVICVSCGSSQFCVLHDLLLLLLSVKVSVVEIAKRTN